jgi:hypothetical protein
MGMAFPLFPLGRLSTKMRLMAVLLQLAVNPASPEQFQDLDALVGRAMMEAGGPPAGLMSHVVFPDKDGFVVADVWRTEAEGMHYLTDQLRPLLDQLGLDVIETSVRPVWSFARP